jgi:hypothetical protein
MKLVHVSLALFRPCCLFLARVSCPCFKRRVRCCSRCSCCHPPPLPLLLLPPLPPKQKSTGIGLKRMAEGHRHYPPLTLACQLPAPALTRAASRLQAHWLRQARDTRCRLSGASHRTPYFTLLNQFNPISQQVLPLRCAPPFCSALLSGM